MTLLIIVVHLLKSYDDFFFLCQTRADYSSIVTRLGYIQGDKSVKQTFIREIISEARKYKKMQLIALLESHLDTVS
jgi:uncharacterized protein YutD